MCAAFFVKVEMENEVNHEQETGDHMTALYDSYEHGRSDADAESGLEETANLARRRKSTRSAVWDFFEKKDLKGEVRCQLCGVMVKGANTSNMLAHLKSYSIKGDKAVMESHRIAAEQCASEIMKKKVLKETARIAHQFSAETSLEESPLVDDCVARKRHRTDDSLPRNQQQWTVDNIPATTSTGCPEEELAFLLALYVLAGMHPVRSVENDQGLQILLGLALNGTSRMPTWQSINKHVDNIFARLKAVIHRLVHEASTVAVTTDIWSFPTGQGFLGVTGHIVTNCDRTQCLLACRRIVNSRGGDRMSELLQECLLSYGIAAKISGVVTDASSYVHRGNADIETRRHSKRDEFEDLILDDTTPGTEEDLVFEDVRIPLASIPGSLDKIPFVRIKCAAQQIHLAVQAGLKDPEIQIFLQGCRQLICRFRGSASLLNKLRHELTQRGLSGAHANQQGSANRWNGTYLMLQRLLEVRDAMEAVANAEKIDFFQPRHFLIIQGIVTILRPFAQALGTIARSDCEEPYQSGISTIVPLIFTLNKQLDNIAIKLPGERSVHNMFQMVHHQLCTRFATLPDFYYAATLLDPRYMDHALSDAQRQTAIEWIAASVANPENGWLETSPSTNQQPAGTWDQSEDLWSSWDKSVTEANEALRVMTHGKMSWNAELDTYVRSSRLPRKQDPLLWWRDRRPVFPLLFKVATRLLSLPSTSAASEGFYVEGRLIMNHLRTSLTDENFEKCVFVKMNMAILKEHVLSKKHKDLLDRLNI